MCLWTGRFGEQCDDGNNVDGDGCSSICEVEEEEPYCGDGNLDSGEQCDDGNNINGDGCSAMCDVEIPEPYCGDGNLDQGEECDDGNNINGDGCSAICDVEEICEYDVDVRYSYGNSFGTGIAVREDGGSWISGAIELIKGNDYEVKYYIDNHEDEENEVTITFKLGSETIITYDKEIDNYHSKTIDLDISQLECDSYHDLSLDIESEYNQICIPDDPSDNYAEREIHVVCEEEPYCGDGILYLATEECDDGNLVDGDGCSSTCEIEEEEPICGNNITEIPEECDLGLLNGFLCWAGYGESCEYCSNSCELINITNYCGDDIKQECEECDDGNLVDGDGCSSICEIEEDEPYCGDGNTDSGEQCDDGNTRCGDGCSSTCEIEEEEPFCGDGNIDSGEECDDGNNVNGDGCSSICEDEPNDDPDDEKRGGFTEFVQFCSPNWECLGWSECSDDIMTRTCTDTNHCDVEYNKPLEQSDCSELSKVYEEQTNNFFWFLVGILIFLILVIVIVNLFK